MLSVDTVQILCGIVAQAFVMMFAVTLAFSDSGHSDSIHFLLLQLIFDF